jgi:uncharacterized membrane protein
LCAQAWRVIFALVSLPLALSAIVFFINHRYDGVMLWDVKTIPGEPAGTDHVICSLALTRGRNHS